MNSDRFCDGCAELKYDPPINRYDYYTAQCCDPEKPVMGTHRIVAVSSLSRPFGIYRPTWCRGKIKKKRKREANPL